MYVTELFKDYSQRVKVDAKKKDLDYINETFANTELFDFSKLKKNENHYNIMRVKNRWLFPYEFNSLPFSSQFIKINDEFCLFIKEYNPETIVGTVFMHYKQVIGLIPFTYYVPRNLLIIEENLIKETEKLFGKELLENVVQMIANIFDALKMLAKYAILVDKNEKMKPEYYTFKDKSKKTIKVTNRPIYYVLDKKDYEKKNYEIKAIGKLEYSHAFKVRGHWRRIDEKSIGKDRNGDYKIEGFTWVTDYIKGDGELVNRVRIVR